MSNAIVVKVHNPSYNRDHADWIIEGRSPEDHNWQKLLSEAYPHNIDTNYDIIGGNSFTMAEDTRIFWCSVNEYAKHRADSNWLEVKL